MAESVFIVDDDPDIRDSLSMLLQSAGYATSTFESATALLDSPAPDTSGCLIVDVQMPEMDGITLQKELVERRSPLQVIVMTGHADIPIAVGAMKAGAVDFIEKPFDDEALLGSVRLALSRYDVVGQSNGQVAQIRARAAGLSARERQVMEGLLAGLPNKTIAYDLAISPRTVEVHRANVMAKMAAKSLSELVRMAILAGLSENPKFQKSS